MVRQAFVISLLFLVVFSISPVFADTGVIPVVAGKTFDVSYNSNGVNIKNIETNPTYDELTVTVQVSSQNALLELTIPRDLLDSKQGSNDIPFITVVDGTLVNVAEKNPTAATRTISVQLYPGNQQIEIIGTYVAATTPSVSPSQTPSVPSTPTQIPPAPTTVTPTPQTPITTQGPSVQEQNQTKLQPNIPQENATAPTNLFQNFVFKIPYLPNATVSLSQIDLAVIGAISLVVVIVIASVARRRPSRIAKKR